MQKSMKFVRIVESVLQRRMVDALCCREIVIMVEDSTVKMENARSVSRIETLLTEKYITSNS